jgi:hypothetical protein
MGGHSYKYPSRTKPWTLGATMAYHRILTFFLFVLIWPFLTGCSLNDQQLKSGWWKYGDGFHIGDVVDFNKEYSMMGDTILQSGKTVGIITRKSKGMFGDDNEIEITSLDKKRSGVYHQK